MTKIKWILCTLVILTLVGARVPAQEIPAILSLETDTTTLQTGQEYEITIRLENVTDLWLVTMEIAYDPTLVYVIGTRAGSPVVPGDFFPRASTLVFQNNVRRDIINYTISLLAPAEPLDGSGILGTFRIYLLAPGETSILFRQASVTAQGPERQPLDLPFTPVMLQLTIQGAPVEPPSEATATPTATPSPTEALESIDSAPTERPTLANVTAAPPTTAEAQPESEEGAQSPLLPVALGMMGIGAMGLIILGLVWIRRRR